MGNQFDLLVMGGGSGGIASAIRAAKHGATVAVFEPNFIGGTCVNVGCVPKKIMWQASDQLAKFSQHLSYGIESKKPQLDWQVLIKHREDYIKKLHGIYINRLKDHNIKLITDYAKFSDQNNLIAHNKKYFGKHIIIATGGRPSVPNLPGSELGITSDGFFKLNSCPKKIAIVGAGYIAVELAGMLNLFGADVSLCYRYASLLRKFDCMLQENLLETYDKHDINLKITPCAH